MSGVDRLILPGVGAFGDGMINLYERGWVPAIREFIGTGRPFLGICLGMQLLFESSEEDAPAGGFVEGLGILPGQVVRFQPLNGGRLKVPHMGWNTLAWQREDPLLEGLRAGDSVYFVHSYYACPEENGEPIACARTEYPQGRPFCSTLWRGNVWATQFHPEKSQRVGLTMLGNFARL
jgi:glutamine amidotransferase